MIIDDKNSEPLCTAPFTSFLVDTNKGVRPCCVWEGDYFGNLKNSSIRDIVHGSEWSKLRRQMMMGQWPDGCISCKNREENTGWSVRQQFVPGGVFYSDNWRDITYIEFSSSNLCNLACLHCSAGFSSSWIGQEQFLLRSGFEDRRGPDDDERFRTHKVHSPSSLITEDVATKMDLSKLEQIMIKGGEPMLNSDIPVLLSELHKSGVLKRITVNIVSNGTLPDKAYADEIYDLLGRAKAVHFDISVDGIGAVQEYIRYGQDCSIEQIERFVGRFGIMPNVRFSLLTSVMAYNIFSLHDITKWWQLLIEKRKRYLNSDYRLFVIDPPYLSLQCLMPETRQRLIDGFEKQRTKVYGHVIKNLKLPQHDEAMRDKLRRYIELTDENRGTSIGDVVPELVEDLKLRL